MKKIATSTSITPEILAVTTSGAEEKFTMNATENSDGTVGKALNVLDKVADYGRPVRFSEVLADSSYPKATLYRLLQTLTNQGMLQYDNDRQTYSLGIRLVRLAHGAWRQATLAPVARPFIDALAVQVGEAVHLAQFDNGHVLFVDKRSATNMFDTLAQAGRIAPCYCTGVGKAILAFLSDDRQADVLKQQSFVTHTPSTLTDIESLERELFQIRDEGVAYDREEFERGIISIAAPIGPPDTDVIGAVSIATSTSRHASEELKQFKPALLETARRITTDAASWRFPS